MVFENWADYFVLIWIIGLLCVNLGIASLSKAPKERGLGYLRFVAVSFWAWLLYMAGTFS